MRTEIQELVDRGLVVVCAHSGEAIKGVLWADEHHGVFCRFALDAEGKKIPNLPKRCALTELVLRDIKVVPLVSDER